MATLVIKSSKDYHKHLGGTHHKTISDEVIIKVDDGATYPTCPITIDNVVFEQTFDIQGPWCRKFLFRNCSFKKFTISKDLELNDLSFLECSFEEFRIESKSSIHALFITRCSKLGTIAIGPQSGYHFIKVYDCPNIRDLSIKANVEFLSIINRPSYTTSSRPNSDRPIQYLTHQSSGKISVDLTEIKSCSLEMFKTHSLTLKGNSSESILRATDIYCNEFHLMEVSGCNAIFKKLDAGFMNEGSITIYSSDLTDFRFHDCRLVAPCKIQSSRVEDVLSIETEWPINLTGSSEENQAGYRQLKLLHQNIGSYRKQFDYNILEMKEFRQVEKFNLKKSWKKTKVLQPISILKWLSQWFEHFIKVFLPSITSRFGLITGRPVIVFFVFHMITVNLLILSQGNTLGIKHELVWPREWDYNLFFHILLPTHRGLFHNHILLEWIDIPWKIISAFLIYHIVISSRKLTRP